MKGALAALALLAAAPAGASDLDCRFSLACLEGSVCAYQLLAVELSAREGGYWMAMPGLGIAVSQTADERLGVRTFVSGVEPVTVEGRERGAVHLLTVFADGEARLTTHGLGRFEGARTRGDAFARTDFGRCAPR